MTTIAYKDGLIAYDSRITNDNVIVDDDFDKMARKGDVCFFITGATSDYASLVESYLQGRYSGDSENVEAKALVFDKSMLYTCAVHNKELWVAPVRLGNPIALGSGSDFALAYMDTGMSAKEAVLRTMQRDNATGGTIRTYCLDVLSSGLTHV